MGKSKINQLDQIDSEVRISKLERAAELGNAYEAELKVEGIGANDGVHFITAETVNSKHIHLVLRNIQTDTDSVTVESYINPTDYTHGTEVDTFNLNHDLLNLNENIANLKFYNGSIVTSLEVNYLAYGYQGLRL